MCSLVPVNGGIMQQWYNACYSMYDLDVHVLLLEERIHDNEFFHNIILFTSRLLLTVVIERVCNTVQRTCMTPAHFCSHSPSMVTARKVYKLEVNWTVWHAADDIFIAKHTMFRLLHSLHCVLCYESVI